MQTGTPGFIKLPTKRFLGTTAKPQEITGFHCVNVEHITAIYEWNGKAHVEIVNSDEPFTVECTVDEVLLDIAQCPLPLPFALENILHEFRSLLFNELGSISTHLGIIGRK